MGVIFKAASKGLNRLVGLEGGLPPKRWVPPSRWRPVSRMEGPAAGVLLLHRTRAVFTSELDGPVPFPLAMGVTCPGIRPFAPAVRPEGGPFDKVLPTALYSTIREAAAGFASTPPRQGTRFHREHQKAGRNLMVKPAKPVLGPPYPSLRR